MDGVDALPDQDTQPGEYRDEFACTCLQFERVMNIMGVQPLIQAIQA